jgi:hypothetical protein
LEPLCDWARCRSGEAGLMFAPTGYTSLAALWNDFIGARLDAAYRSASAFYADPKSNVALSRGSPLDIAEYVFLELMWKGTPHIVAKDGLIFSIFSNFEDGQTGLFTKIHPIFSAHCVAAGEIEGQNTDDLNDFAGKFFEPWNFDPADRSAWVTRYPVSAENQNQVSEKQVESLRFHGLPIGFARARFTIVDRLPFWSTFKGDLQQVKCLVDEFPGRPICVPNEKLKGWDKILSGETPVFDAEEAFAATKNFGRPKKVDRTAEIYSELFPAGHNCSFKEVRSAVERQLGTEVGETTLRRAIRMVADGSNG